MKNSFNFIQVANLIYIIRNNFLNIDKDISKEEFINFMNKQKYYLKLFKDVLEKKKKLIGIQKQFLKDLVGIKEQLNLEENKCHHSQ